MRLAVLVSGPGTTLKYFIDHGLPIDLVIADRSCRAMEIAAENGIPPLLIPRTKPFDRKEHTRQVTNTLVRLGIDRVAMAGYRTVMEAFFFLHYLDKAYNSHPSLLPLFAGAHAIPRAIEAKMIMTGYTVHKVTPILDDHRFILAQESVPIMPGDTEETVRARIQKKEYPAYLRIMREVMAGKHSGSDV